MKVLLLTGTRYGTPQQAEERGTEAATLVFRRRFLGTVPHLGAGIIMTELKRLGADCKVADIYDDKAIAMGKDADLVGLSGKSLHCDQIVKVGNELMKHKIKVIAGGPGVSLAAERILARAPGISVCVGESEGLWAQIIDDAKTGRMKEVYRREKPLDLRYEYVVPDRSLKIMNSARGLMSMFDVIEFGRGCHNLCDFCGEDIAHGRTVRTRDPGEVKREIDSINRNKLLFVVDNNLSSYPADYLIEIFRYMKKTRRKWTGAGTEKQVIENEAVLEAMSGNCVIFFTGPEDFWNDVRGAKDKKTDITAFEEHAKIFKSYGIPVVYSLVFGLDGQGPQIFQETANLVRKIKITPVSHIATPYPGTVFHRRLQEEGRILTDDLSLYDHRHVVFQPKNMTIEELGNGYSRFLREVFLSASSYFERFASDIRGFNDILRQIPLIPVEFDGIGKALHARSNAWKKN
ncbi:MAG: radical SAM protein [Candidatus Micrarchaeota archaeon]